MQSEKQHRASLVTAAFGAGRVQSPHRTWGRTNKINWLRTVDRLKLRPNDLGNYPGKRKARITPPPLTPDQQFAHLQALYLERRRTYRPRNAATRTPNGADFN